MVCPDVPSAPLNVRASQLTADSVTVDWTKPRSDGGSPLTGYVIERREQSSSYWTRVGAVDQRRTTHVVTNLRQGAEYYLQVSIICSRTSNYLRRRRRLCFWFGLFVCLSVGLLANL